MKPSINGHFKLCICSQQRHVASIKVEFIAKTLIALIGNNGKALSINKVL
jgi:hypothetical protein